MITTITSKTVLKQKHKKVPAAAGEPQGHRADRAQVHRHRLQDGPNYNIILYNIIRYNII